MAATPKAVTCVLHRDVIKYRRMLAAQRDISMRELDNEVWRDYMERHPLPAPTEETSEQKETT